MIISHEHKYIFIEIPRTACTAISAELCENYGGERILYKHSLYNEFLRVAKPEEKNYFLFAGVRNPLDDVVAQYFKLKTNHKKSFTTPKAWRRNGGFISDNQLRQFNFIQKNNADFVTYFKKFHKMTYDQWISVDSQYFDYVIRFENLQDDFARVLQILKLEQKRALPLINKTTGNKEDNSSLYYTPEIQGQAKAVLGPFMKKWGYDFPTEWGNDSLPWIREFEFELVGIVRSFYRKYIRQNTGTGLPKFLQLR